jgi:hypothetical protein
MIPEEIMSIEILQVLLTMGGLVIAAVGVPLLYFQLREVERSIHAATHAAMYDQAANIRSYLIQYPYLRKYFFDGSEITAEHEDYDRVLTLAEIFLNYLEYIAVLGDSFGRENRPALDRFCKIALQRSPILRKHLSENRDSYSNALHRFLGN